jgi:alanine-synthesizing transaminase
LGGDVFLKKVIPSKRTEHVEHALREVVPVAQEVEKTGKKVYYLNIGDPAVYDFRTPPHIWDAMFSHKKEGEGYSNALGYDGAREAIANYAKKMGALNVEKDDVMTFVGGSEAILLAMQALVDSDENVLTPCPAYSVYTAQLNFLGCRLNEYHLDEENEWQTDTDELRKKINEKTKAIVVISPNNPTGAVLSKKITQETIDIAGEHDLFIFSDETYDQLLFDREKFYPFASLAKDVPVISCGSISKTYLCPGFRGGWLYKHDPQNALSDYWAAMQKLGRVRLSTVMPVQFAIEAALNGPQDHLKEVVPKLEKRRDFVYKRFNEIKGFSCVKPKGAFYAFPKIDLPIKSDKEFVLDLIRKTGVVTVWGAGFGQKEGTHHLRIVFLPNEEIMGTAFGLIEGYVKENF